MLKTALIVILYNPDIQEVSENISSYIDSVDLLITVDNSETSNHQLETSDKIIHIRNNENLGIAKALNQGIIKAKELNFQYAILMDQDSQFFDATKAINALHIAIQDKESNFISSSIVVNANIAPKENQKELKYIDNCITSGSMLRLSMTDDIGLHDEKLFIDYVDFEYCLRARNMGYTIVETKLSTLKHLIGDSKKVSMKFFPWYKTYATNHSPLRRYYRWRNSVYVWRKYYKTNPKWVKKNIRHTFNDLKKILLFEDQRFLKFRAIFLGIKDAYQERYGIRKNL